jgi:hypothetical protein
MPAKTYLPMLRELASCYPALERCSALQVCSLGLTPARLDRMRRDLRMLRAAFPEARGS